LVVRSTFPLSRIFTAAELSTCSTEAGKVNPNSLSKFLENTTSSLAIEAATYSPLVAVLTIVGIFTDLHRTGEPM
jgi:hypothetical protein